MSINKRLSTVSPFLVLLTVWIFFALPYFFGKTPFPSEYQVNFFSPWSSYEEFAGPVKNNAMPDVITQIVPWKKFTIDSLKLGELPLWNPYSFSGTPHLANYQSAVLTPLNILFFFLPFFNAWTLLVILQPLLAGIFMYLFIRALDVSKMGSVISGISFMFCGFMTVWMAYGTLGYAILFLPLALLSVEKFYRTENKAWLLLLPLSVFSSFMSGHFQTSLYLLLVVFFFILYKFYDDKNISKFLTALLFLTSGVLLTMPQVVPSLEFYLYSVRQEIVQKVEVIPWGYFPTLLAPDFFGNPVTRNDWFGHYAEWNGYVGVIPLILAGFSVMSKKRIKVFFFLLAFLSIIFAFDSPVQDLIVQFNVPFFSTSAASRIIVLFSFSIAALSGIGFDQLHNLIESRKIKKTLIVPSIFGICFGVLWIVIFSKMGLSQEQAVTARNNLILPSALFAVFSIPVFTLLFLRKWRRPALFLLGMLMLFLVSFDMLRFAKKWMPYDAKSLAFISVPTTRAYASLETNNRFLGDADAENTVYYGLKSVGGYDPLYVGRYGEFIKYVAKGELSSGDRSVVRFPKDGKFTPQALELLGIEYISHKISDGQAAWAFPFTRYPVEQFSIIHDDGNYQIFRNNNPSARVYIASDTHVIRDGKKILDTLFEKDDGVGMTVVLEEETDVAIGQSASGSAVIMSENAGKIEVSAESTSDAMLVLSDVFYPGWKATVNGREVKLYRANYTFKAVQIPEGESTVTFSYRPDSFRNGVFLFFGGIVLVGATFVKKRIFAKL